MTLNQTIANTIAEGVAQRCDEVGDKTAARIYRLTPQQARSALTYLSGYDQALIEKALDWGEAVSE